MEVKNEMAHQQFALRFKKACRMDPRAPKSQGGLGKYIGVSPPMIHAWRHGYKLPSTDTGIKIAVKLGVSFEWLMTGRGPEKPATDKTEGPLQEINSLTPDLEICEWCIEVLQYAYEQLLGDKTNQVTPREKAETFHALYRVALRDQQIMTLKHSTALELIKNQ